jgi:hypothetical protein
MSLNCHESEKRKGKYFTNSFLTSLITTALEEAKQHGPYTLFFIRIYLGEEFCYIYEELNEIFNLMKNYPRSRKEQASQRALFYRISDLETLKKILINNLDSLELDEHTDVEGKLLDLDL